MVNRRSFLQQSAIIGAGLFVAPSLLTAESKKIKKVGLQLYTLREFIGKDVKGVIQKVAQSGYRYAETYGYTKKAGFWGLNAKDFEKLLDDNGMSSPSGHYTFEDYFRTGADEGLKNAIEAANILGSDYVTVPWLPVDLRKTSDDWKKIAVKLNEAGELCKQSGMKIAYHNHDFEFSKMDGDVGYDILMNETDSKLVKFEMDLYWVVRAGYDPIALFRKEPFRFVMWHVKDMSNADMKKNTEVGNGSVDFSTIFANERVSGVKYIFVEQENNYEPDPFESIKISNKYIYEKLIK